MADKQDAIMMLSMFFLVIMAVLSESVPKPLNYVVLVVGLVPMFIGIRLAEMFAEYSGNKQDHISGPIVPHTEKGPFDIFFENLQAGPETKFIGIDNWTFPYDGTSVEVPKWMTTLNIPKSFEIKNYPGYGRVRKIGVIHLLSFNARMAFSKGRQRRDGIDVEHTHSSQVVLQETMKPGIDDDNLPYPILYLNWAQGDVKLNAPENRWMVMSEADQLEKVEA